MIAGNTKMPNPDSNQKEKLDSSFAADLSDGLVLDEPLLNEMSAAVKTEVKQEENIDELINRLITETDPKQWDDMFGKTSATLMTSSSAAFSEEPAMFFSAAAANATSSSTTSSLGGFIAQLQTVDGNFHGNILAPSHGHNGYPATSSSATANTAAHVKKVQEIITINDTSESDNDSDDSDDSDDVVIIEHTPTSSSSAAATTTTTAITKTPATSTTTTTTKPIVDINAKIQEADAELLALDKKIEEYKAEIKKLQNVTFEVDDKEHTYSLLPKDSTQQQVATYWNFQRRVTVPTAISATATPITTPQLIATSSSGRVSSSSDRSSPSESDSNTSSSKRLRATPGSG